MTGDRVLADCFLQSAIARIELLRAALIPASADLPADGMLVVLDDVLADLERLRTIVVPDETPMPPSG